MPATAGVLTLNKGLSLKFLLSLKAEWTFELYPLHPFMCSYTIYMVLMSVDVKQHRLP